MLKIGLAPIPQPIISRFTPTIPVNAPPKGSSAEGELWVSTFIAKRFSSSISMIPPPSINTDLSQGISGCNSSVTLLIYDLKSELIFNFWPESLSV